MTTLTMVLLLLLGCTSANQESTQLIAATKAKEYENVEALVSKADNLNLKDEAGFTALYYLTMEAVQTTEKIKKVAVDRDASQAAYGEALKEGAEVTDRLLALLETGGSVDSTTAELEESNAKLERMKVGVDALDTAYFGYQEYRLGLLALMNESVARGASLTTRMGDGKTVMDIAKDGDPELYETFQGWEEQLQ